MAEVELHQMMVIALVRKFNEDRFKLLGATYFRDLAETPKFGRHRPDVLAESSDGTLHVGEAKLEYNLDSQKTFEQFTDFLNAPSPNGKPAHLHIIVLKELNDKLEELLDKWKFNRENIHIWTY